MLVKATAQMRRDQPSAYHQSVDVGVIAVRRAWMAGAAEALK
jgi:hypothetical protein